MISTLQMRKWVQESELNCAVERGIDPRSFGASINYTPLGPMEK